ncbi:MAG: geranylgeranylglyceryl/heptaprenylglyceryl phosphate synthase [Bacteroidales bacterium]
MSILEKINNNGPAKFAVLVDPDKASTPEIESLVQGAESQNVDFFFVGGSYISSGDIGHTIAQIKQKTHIPVVLFPGSVLQIDPSADALLFLSLISGRNPDYLIGQHVIAAPYLHKLSMEVIPTGYMLIDSGKSTTASYMSNTIPLPINKPELAASTALAGEMLGMKLIYADAGSGAQNSIPPNIITAIKNKISIPLIIGGGIKDKETAKNCIDNGADLIVVGNAIEKNPHLINEISSIL